MREQASQAAARFGLDDARTGEEPPAVSLTHVDGSEEDLLAACLYEVSDAPEEELRAAAAALGAGRARGADRGRSPAPRGNRRHRPGRGFEAVRYRFEIVSRLRRLPRPPAPPHATCQWQRLGCELGADVPEEVEAAGYGDAYREGLELSRAEHDRLRDAGIVEEAPYAVALAYRIRYVIDMNAREAMHLIELRSGREGHTSYRAVALEMLDRIAAVHPSVAAAMTLRRPRDRGAAGAPPGRDAPAPAARGRAPVLTCRTRPLPTSRS